MSEPKPKIKFMTVGVPMNTPGLEDAILDTVDLVGGSKGGFFAEAAIHYIPIARAEHAKKVESLRGDKGARP